MSKTGVKTPPVCKADYYMVNLVSFTFYVYSV